MQNLISYQPTSNPQRREETHERATERTDPSPEPGGQEFIFSFNAGPESRHKAHEGSNGHGFRYQRAESNATPSDGQHGVSFDARVATKSILMTLKSSFSGFEYRMQPLPILAPVSCWRNASTTPIFST